MRQIQINTSKSVVPKCYAYTTPTVAGNQGWVKIGYTEQEVEDRINQQLKTAHIPHKTEWWDTAFFNDGTCFRDHDFHAYLKKLGVERMKPLPGDTKDPEWFRISPDDSLLQFSKFRQNKGILTVGETMPYALREEQEDAVSKTISYFESHENAEFLWNAKPRFGKTLATYELCKRLKEKSGDKAFNVLILTNRPAIANSWYDDYVKFMGQKSGFMFVSKTNALKSKPYVSTNEQYLDFLKSCGDEMPSKIEFVSLQDLKGGIDFGGDYEKFENIKDTSWGLLVLDEAHEATDTSRATVAFNQIHRKYTLHLSGTPFKALANNKFSKEAIFNWTYADERAAKRDWDYEKGSNPYEHLPKLNMFTYQMSEAICEEVKKGVEIDGETVEYTFDLNEFFSTRADGNFVHEDSVDKFLDALTTCEKYPFSTPELRGELKHTLWMLDRVDSVKALARKLEKHPVFKEYKVVPAAGDGKMSDDEAREKSFDKVRKAIDENEKTITLSVRQLTTGVTVPEWSAVLMLSNLQSTTLYMQAAFRAQNPYERVENNKLIYKENAFVFDFDPARTLEIFENFANGLSSETSGGKGDGDKRKQNVRELLNFFPVVGEDENGEMIELDAEKVLSIPRKIRSLEAVRRGFMSNFLFQNVYNVFGAPKTVTDILNKFTPVSEKKMTDISEDVGSINVAPDGKPIIDPQDILNKTKEIFGDKIYSDELITQIDNTIQAITSEDPELKQINDLKEQLHSKLILPIVTLTNEKYGSNLKIREKANIQKELEKQTDAIIDREIGNHKIEVNKIKKQREKALSDCENSGKTENEVNKEFNDMLKAECENFSEKLARELGNSQTDLIHSAVKQAETVKKEHIRDSAEDDIRARLRGFSRTIPSFLMAYGDENTTLENFDEIIPEGVFKEVTSISLDEFRYLRDGGDKIDENTGETKHFDGKLFDPVVFDDSVKEFLLLKKRLANYFDESNTDDIFDYIPPQKKNQIFTPKKVVKQMVDMLEEENPGCFDNPDKTFADLYMKSGLYIAEIVKRLFRSEVLKADFPDETERLKHIFEKQVFGLAPTEIIYRIAVNFILGFDENMQIGKHNLKQLDTLPLAKDGTLSSKLDEIFA